MSDHGTPNSDHKSQDRRRNLDVSSAFEFGLYGNKGPLTMDGIINQSSYQTPALEIFRDAKRRKIVISARVQVAMTGPWMSASPPGSTTGV